MEMEMEMESEREMETATKSGSREERRRRILSREMDRMAVITGRLKNLPPSPPPSPSSPTPLLYRQNHHRGHSHTGISPSFFSKEIHKNPDAALIPQFDVAAIPIPKPKDERAGSLLKHMSINEVQKEIITAAIGCQIHHKRNDPIVEGSTVMAMSTPSAALSMVQKATIDNEPEPKTLSSKPKLFTSKRLNSCILASQTTRLFCSLIIASLAVLSHINHPFFIIRDIVRSESVVASKPLYILLLTDATIVVARMLAERQKDGEGAEEEGERVKEDGHNWDSAVKVLERGLVFYQAFRAIFIDFSVYAVVVICGLSLV